MRAILPVDLSLMDEPDEHFVHKSCRLQGVVSALAAKLARRNAPEFRIDERQELVERSPVAATPIAQQCRDVARRNHRGLLQSIGSNARASIAPEDHTPLPFALTRSALRLRDLHISGAGCALRRPGDTLPESEDQQEQQEENTNEVHGS